MVPPDIGQTVNVRIELTITDQRGEATPITKTVSMIASDRSWSRIRTQGDVRTPTGFRPVILNVDARPWLVRENRARVELTIEVQACRGRGRYGKVHDAEHQREPCRDPRGWKADADLAVGRPGHGSQGEGRSEGVYFEVATWMALSASLACVFAF